MLKNIRYAEQVADYIKACHGLPLIEYHQKNENSRISSLAHAIIDQLVSSEDTVNTKFCCFRRSSGSRTANCWSVCANTMSLLTEICATTTDCRIKFCSKSTVCVRNRFGTVVWMPKDSFEKWNYLKFLILDNTTSKTSFANSIRFSHRHVQEFMENGQIKNILRQKMSPWSVNHLWYQNSLSFWHARAWVKLLKDISGSTHMRSYFSYQQIKQTSAYRLKNGFDEICFQACNPQSFLSLLSECRFHLEFAVQEAQGLLGNVNPAVDEDTQNGRRRRSEMERYNVKW